jgi:hypothetical protein
MEKGKKEGSFSAAARLLRNARNFVYSRNPPQKSAEGAS